jgi:hypothetical protein
MRSSAGNVSSHINMAIMPNGVAPFLRVRRSRFANMGTEMNARFGKENSQQFGFLELSRCWS